MTSQVWKDCVTTKTINVSFVFLSLFLLFFVLGEDGSYKPKVRTAVAVVIL